jgi:predicted transglutaminase-like cysteine proteinase
MGLVLVILAIPVAQADGMSTLSYPALFGTREIHSDDLTMFPKWRSVLDRSARELRGCPSDRVDARQWCQLIDTWRGLDRMAQLRAVNSAMNKRRYVPDIVNWHQSDYWATPVEFLRKGGDCEDYAIAKYMALKTLDVPVDAMRILVLQDLNLRVPHAIVVVYVAGGPILLDNQISRIVPASSTHRYQPVYSINEHGWWQHRSPMPEPLVTASAAPWPTAPLASHVALGLSASEME